MNLIQNIISDIKAVSRAIKLPICFHSRLPFEGIPQSITTHSHPACVHIKKKYTARCVAYDIGLIHSRLMNHSEGEIHQCPFGFHEIAVPIVLHSGYGGVLFGGPCRLSSCDKSTISPIEIPNIEWLEDRMVVVQSLATKIASMVNIAEGEPKNRKAHIMNAIIKNNNQPIQLSDIAKIIHLSPSRTGHLIKELFNETFPELVNRIKMNEATRLLLAGNRSISNIAESLGYRDPNYFSRVFSEVYEISPRKYRKKSQLEA